MKHATSGTLRVAYEDAGQGEPACILVHGPFGNREQLATLRDHLAANHRVLALDLRGSGESDRPDSGYRIGDFAEDVLAVCRQASVKGAVLIGHSLGAAIALEVTAREPGLVAGMVMLDGAILYPEALREQLLNGPIQALDGPAWLEMLRGYVGERMFDPADPADVKASVLETLATLPPRLAAELMRDAMSRDFSELFARGRYPLLYIHARVPADLGRMKQLRPDAIIASVVGSGHFMTMIVPDQVNAMVDRFLATAVFRTSDAHMARR